MSSWSNKHDKRPMSPHLQIYDLPLAAKLSILHRATGAILFVGLILIVSVLYISSSNIGSWHSLHSFLSSWIGKTILFSFTFALYYHLCNGIRHLLWDIGKGLSLKQTELSNKLVLGASTLFTLLTWLIPEFTA